MFGGILAGVAASACLYHYLFAHYDQADALLQVAKFQERSIRTRKDAVDLVDKIREEVSRDERIPAESATEESESDDAALVTNTGQSDQEETSAPLAPDHHKAEDKEVGTD